MKLLITEEIEYEVVADTVYHCVRKFLDEPDRHRTNISERWYSIQTSQADEPFRSRALDETEMANAVSAEDDA